MMALHGFASRDQKNTFFLPKTLKYDPKPKNKTQNPKNNPEIFQVNIVEACRPKTRRTRPRPRGTGKTSKNTVYEAIFALFLQNLRFPGEPGARIVCDYHPGQNYVEKNSGSFFVFLGCWVKY